MNSKEKMHLCVSAYKNPPVILRKTMKRKKKGGGRRIKIDNGSKVKYKGKYENNELMEYTLLCTGMIVEQKTPKYNSGYYEKNSENWKKDSLFIKLLQPLNLKLAREYHLWTTHNISFMNKPSNQGKIKKKKKKEKRIKR